MVDRRVPGVDTADVRWVLSSAWLLVRCSRCFRTGLPSHKALK